MELPPGTILLTADATSMYTNIQTRTALNQIAQYVNGNKTRYLNLPVNAMLGALHLIIKKKIRFIDIHWLQLKVTAMVTPPAPTYATVFYGIFELSFLERFGNNLLLYRILIDNLMVLGNNNN